MNKIFLLLLVGGIGAGLYVAAYHFNLIPALVLDIVQSTRPTLSWVKPYVAPFVEMLKNPVVLVGIGGSMLALLINWLRTSQISAMTNQMNEATANLQNQMQSQKLEAYDQLTKLNTQNTDLTKQLEIFKGTNIEDLQKTIQQLTSQNQELQSQKTELERLVAQKHIIIEEKVK